MKVHFLNVGHGDCTIIEHSSGRLTMVDLNNSSEPDSETLADLTHYVQSKNSTRIAEAYGVGIYRMTKEAGYSIKLTNPVEFLQKNYPGKDIFRYIQTHPHLDHMRGIEQLRESQIGIINFWDIEHNFAPDLTSDSDRASWREYERLRVSNQFPTALRLWHDASGTYWNQEPKGVAGGDGIEILHPKPYTQEVIKMDENVNNLGYVLRVTLGKANILLAGDAETDVWDYLVETYKDNLKCDVLKASHHGRDSGFHKDAMKLMQPRYTIVSVGKKPENDASNKYLKYCPNVWSTRWKGNVDVTFDCTGRGTIKAQYNR